jgi:hypothetical protein
MLILTILIAYTPLLRIPEWVSFGEHSNISATIDAVFISSMYLQGNSALY